MRQSGYVILTLAVGALLLTACGGGEGISESLEDAAAGGGADSAPAKDCAYEGPNLSVAELKQEYIAYNTDWRR